MKKIIACTIILTVLLLGGSGCMFNKPKENINTVAVKYMEQKYGGKFEYYAPFGNSMSGTHQFLVRCDSFPDHDILVEIENYKKDDKTFLDNYLAVKYHNDTINFISKCANQVFTEADVYCNVVNQVLSADLPANATFEEYLSDTQAPLLIEIEVKASNFASKDQLQELCGLIGAYGSCYYLTVVISDDNDFGAENIDALEDKVKNKNYLHCARVTSFLDKMNVKWVGED